LDFHDCFLFGWRQGNRFAGGAQQNFSHHAIENDLHIEYDFANQSQTTTQKGVSACL
jgi:hypothetical protein